MGLLSTILRGAVGFVTGGPLGAAASLFGGGGSSGASPGTVAPVANVAGIGQQAAQPAAPSLDFLRGYLDQAAVGAAKPTTYNAQAALGGGLSQLSNQRGGMKSVPDGSIQREQLGEGKGGGGGTSTTDQWRTQSTGILNQPRQQYAAPLQSAFGDYMQNALAGRETLPASSYARAQSQGMDTINAQAQHSREQLQSALGSRGMAQSGLMAGGLAGVQQQRLGSMGSLAGGLAQQGLEASRESQRQAAGMFPQLASIDQQSQQSQLQGWLAVKQLELEAQRVGISQQQIDEARNSGNYSVLGSLVSAATQLWGGSNGGGSGVAASSGGNNSGGYWGFYPDNMA